MVKRSIIIIVATVPACVSPIDALANGKHHGHTSHGLPSWHAERDFGYGWGWDPRSVGYYEGPHMGAPRQGLLSLL
jgi:hypothetical protein